MVKVGPLFIVGFEGTEVDEKIKHLIHEYQIGGVILFNRNLQSVEQVKRLTTALQMEAKQAGYEQPLLICLDQENGSVRRINQGVTLFPGAMALAATGDRVLTEAVHFATGQELSELGINWNLSPVSDINSNPENPIIGVRSFGDDGEVATPFIASAIRGSQKAGVISCLKHFPGHGDTATDSHLSLPIVDKSRAELNHIELYPYQQLIKHEDVQTIMISHILFPQLAQQPASLAPEIIEGILRRDLGYVGVVTTDCLEMAAIADGIGIKEGAYQALLAGNDLVMISHTYQEQLNALKYLLEKQTEDAVLLERLVESNRRVSQLKTLIAEGQKEISNKVTHQELAEVAYKKGITRYQTTNKVIKTDEKLAIIFPNNKTQLRVEDIQESFNLSRIFSNLSQSIDCFYYDDKMSENQMSDLMAQLTGYQQIILCTLNLSKESDILKIVASLNVPNLNLICLKNPYDLKYLPLHKFEQIILTYEPSPHVLEMAAGCFKNPQSYTGKLPVKL